jgi:hypothetical protein
MIDITIRVIVMQFFLAFMGKYNVQIWPCAAEHKTVVPGFGRHWVRRDQRFSQPVESVPVSLFGLTFCLFAE